MALSISGIAATDWSYINGAPHISEHYYLIGMYPEMKECCNTIAKYFSITNNKLEYFINHTVQLSRPDHLLPLTIIDAFVLKFHSDPNITRELLKKINKVFEEKQLKCRLKLKDCLRDLVEQHNFILEQTYLDSRYEDNFLKQSLSIDDINLMPILTEVKDESCSHSTDGFICR